jgi:hypothetical protein
VANNVNLNFVGRIGLGQGERGKRITIKSVLMEHWKTDKVEQSNIQIDLNKLLLFISIHIFLFSFVFQLQIYFFPTDITAASTNYNDEQRQMHSEALDLLRSQFKVINNHIS